MILPKHNRKNLKNSVQPFEMQKLSSAVQPSFLHKWYYKRFHKNVVILHSKFTHNYCRIYHYEMTTYKQIILMALLRWVTAYDPPRCIMVSFTLSCSHPFTALIKVSVSNAALNKLVHLSSDGRHSAICFRSEMDDIQYDYAIREQSCTKIRR